MPDELRNSLGDVFRQVGAYTGSILKGAKLADPCFTIGQVWIHHQSATGWFARSWYSSDAARTRWWGVEWRCDVALARKRTRGSRRL